MPDAAPQFSSLSTILRALAEELQAMGRIAEKVQTTLSPVLLQAATDPARRQDVQACDRLTQLLFGAATFVSALEPGIPPDWRVDAITAGKKVLLADLGQRLCGLGVSEPDHDAGDLEMF